MCSNNDSYCVEGRQTFEQWAWVGIDSFLFVLILGGNLFTVYVLTRNSKVISNRFVLSLAITDTLVGLTLPYHIALTLFPELSVKKSPCIVRYVLILLACCCSVLNVTAIAIDRYLAIIHPFKYETLMTKRVVRRVLFIAFMCAITMSTVPIYWNNWDEAKVCELGQVLPRYYMTAVVLPAFLVIWAVMIVIYTRIWQEAVLQAEKLRRNNVFANCKPSFQVVLLVMGCFTACWLPFLTVTSAQAAGYRENISSTVYQSVLSLALCSSALNPLIYAWKNAEFKETVRGLLKCKDKKQLATVVTVAGSKQVSNGNAPLTPV